MHSGFPNKSEAKQPEKSMKVADSCIKNFERYRTKCRRRFKTSMVKKNEMMQW